EEKQPAAEPEAVTRNADGTFDVSALFPPPSNQTEKTEARTERDGETPKESNQQETQQKKKKKKKKKVGS
ncbi:exodeoxyribonuclease 8, partial [Salmonella enterica subsp. enterica serovar Newport str. SHSN007]|uniref:hypothetical protein n=1 Tax=Salmonella enterica TaxID=28901 RepID=UPI000A18A1FD